MNKNMIKKITLKGSKATIFASSSSDLFFIIAEFWSLSECYKLKLDRISTQKTAHEKCV